ncbi:hydrogenase maturation nickel metallochaperone HypA [Novosphingobium sp. 1949]|uniref:Hydrogenase maturation factor HypA n=1 Tax=Novosphingobium organovorum TaxID=2930092 RepID=A0ABT0BD83_9SPHN|nr:hydrogenase maturation nickel metallochaperone HypA [Novosphingobium organovorum]MCJ2182808.1 hydrogenase maturation nickel metallochaperone HypA [Novosphingobium organovorum]
MHEMALCESIRQIIEEQAQGQGFTRVARVALDIGVFSGVEAQALRFGFDVVMKGSVAQDARLEIHVQPATAWCLPCGHEVGLAQRYDACPDCGSYQLQVTGGENLSIRELEVY